MKFDRTPLRMLGFWLIVTLAWWGFAFMPTFQGAPEWLEVARNVCFGTLESGVPDTYGWMLLILGPGSFLIGLLITWPKDLQIGLRTFVFRPTGRAIVLLSLSAMSVEALWVFQKVSNEFSLRKEDFRAKTKEGLPPDYPQTNQLASDFALSDQYGEQLHLSRLYSEGKIVLLSFVFAHCQTICPAIVEQLKEVLHELDSKPVELLLVTLDPWRDTPSSLRALANRWNLPSNARILSGEVSVVTDVLQKYNVPYRRNETTGNIDHPALTYLIDSEGQIVYIFNNVPPHWIVQAIARL